MAWTATRYPATVTNGGGGGTAWGNPTYAVGPPNGTVASMSLAVGASSQNAICTGYGFAADLPYYATAILAIKVSPTRAQDTASGGVRDVLLKLVVDGSLKGNSKEAAATEWPAAPAVADYSYGVGIGGWLDLLSNAATHAATFGCALAAKNNDGAAARTPALSSVAMAIQYTPPTPRYYGGSCMAEPDAALQYSGDT